MLLASMLCAAGFLHQASDQDRIYSEEGRKRVEQVEETIARLRDEGEDAMAYRLFGSPTDMREGETQEFLRIYRAADHPEVHEELFHRVVHERSPVVWRLLVNLLSGSKENRKRLLPILEQAANAPAFLHEDWTKRTVCYIKLGMWYNEFGVDCRTLLRSVLEKEDWNEWSPPPAAAPVVYRAVLQLKKEAWETILKLVEDSREGARFVGAEAAQIAYTQAGALTAQEYFDFLKARYEKETLFDFRKILVGQMMLWVPKESAEFLFAEAGQKKGRDLEVVYDALTKIEPTKLAPLAMKAVQGGDPDVRPHALFALAQSHDHAGRKAIVDFLRTLTLSREEAVKVLLALRFKGDAPSWGFAKEWAWSDQADPEILMTAAGTLVTIGPRDPATAAEIKRILREHPQTVVRARAVDQLILLLMDPVDVLEVAARNDADVGVRAKAILGIGEIAYFFGPDRRGARAVLEKLAEDPALCALSGPGTIRVDGESIELKEIKLGTVVQMALRRCGEYSPANLREQQESLDREYYYTAAIRSEKIKQVRCPVEHGQKRALLDGWFVDPGTK